jgi:hypothetical protein
MAIVVPICNDSEVFLAVFCGTRGEGCGDRGGGELKLLMGEATKQHLILLGGGGVCCRIDVLREYLGTTSTHKNTSKRGE